jgi:hypothetical protein
MSTTNKEIKLHPSFYEQNANTLQGVVDELRSILGLSYGQSLLAEVRKLKAQEIQQIGWRIFDGEGGYDWFALEDNETLAEDFIARNGQHYASWVEPVYSRVCTRFTLTKKEST